MSYSGRHGSQGAAQPHADLLDAARAWAADFAASLRSNAVTAFAPAKVTTIARALARACRSVSEDLIGVPGGQYRSRLNRSDPPVFPGNLCAAENVHKTGFGGVTDAPASAGVDADHELRRCLIPLRGHQPDDRAAAEADDGGGDHDDEVSSKHADEVAQIHGAPVA